MGHKVHPYGFRLGVSRTWTAKWYADKEYTTLLQEDIAIRSLVARRLANASISQIEIERGINHVTVTVPRPSRDRHRQGRPERGDPPPADRRAVEAQGEAGDQEIRQPELDAYLVAMNIAQQLTRRIAFRKALKQGIQRTMKAGAKGVKIMVAGRLGGSEMARREWTRKADPAGTLRADISYGESTPTRPTVGSASRSGSTVATSSGADAGARRGRRPGRGCRGAGV